LYDEAQGLTHHQKRVRPIYERQARGLGAGELDF
jgi:hypothetical protein